MLLSRLTLIFIVLIAGGFGVLLKYLLDGLEGQTLQATEEGMVDTAHILAGLVESELTSSNSEINVRQLKSALDYAQQHSFSAKIYRLEKNKIGINLYVTNKQGIVILDTGRPDREGSDFSQFNDVLRTLEGTYGARSTRVNEEDPNSSELHVAAPITSKNEIIGVLSVYKSQSDVDPFIDMRRQWITVSCGMIATGILLFSIAVFIWLFQPIGKLTRYAEAISRGKRPKLPHVGQGAEANTLANALGNMRETLEGRRYMENYIQILTHELKSPLAAIRGAAELLEETMPEEQRKRFLSNIQHETERSQRVIDGLLKLSRLEGRHHIDHVEPIHLETLFNDVCQIFQQRSSTKQLKFHLNIPSDLSIIGDTMMLHTAIGNLLENAIEFSPLKGSIQITASPCQSGEIKISIQDQGPGIPEFALSRIFEHFYSRAEDGAQKSSGLGLAFVKEVAQLHNGNVSAKNVEPTGACLTLRLHAIERDFSETTN